MDHIILPDEIPLPPEDIPLPPDEVPLPPDEISPPPPPGDETAVSQRASHKRPYSPAPDSRPKKSKSEHAREKKKARKARQKIDADIGRGSMDLMTDEEAIMARMMGFSKFNSTKGKMVPGNQSVGAIHVIKKQRCRQYMNRKGGFNRPLDKTS